MSISKGRKALVRCISILLFHSPQPWLDSSQRTRILMDSEQGLWSRVPYQEDEAPEQ